MSASNIIFCDDKYFLTRTSSNTDTELLVRLKVSHYDNAYNPAETNVEAYVPYFAGEAKLHIGEIVKQLFPELTKDFINALPMVWHGSYQYKPAEVEITTQEINVDGTIAATLADETHTMVKGKDPATSQTNKMLNELPIKNLVPGNAILFFNYMADSAGYLEYAINDQFFTKLTPTTGELISQLYKFQLRLDSLLPILSVGDKLSIRIVVGSNILQTYNFYVKPTELNTTYIFFENKWGLIECFTASGLREKTDTYDFKDFEFYINREKERKTIDIDKDTMIDVYTGFLYYDDARFVSDMLSSKNIWLSTADLNPIKVIAKTKKLTISNTNKNLIGNKLSFQVV